MNIGRAICINGDITICCCNCTSCSIDYELALCGRDACFCYYASAIQSDSANRSAIIAANISFVIDSKCRFSRHRIFFTNR